MPFNNFNIKIEEIDSSFRGVLFIFFNFAKSLEYKNVLDNNNTKFLI